MINIIMILCFFAVSVTANYIRLQLQTYTYTHATGRFDNLCTLCVCIIMNPVCMYGGS